MRSVSLSHSLPVLGLALVLGPLLAPAARADVPVFVDGPVFAKLCADIGKGLDCPTCRCEATSSTPSIGVTKDATDWLHGIVVEVRGKTTAGDKDVHEVHVFLGDETKLVDGGVVAQLSVAKGKHVAGTWELAASKQAYDMCPGSCDWDAVGIVHLFEIRQNWREGAESLDDAMEYWGGSLVACFEHDKKPGCWMIDLGMDQQTVQKVAGSDKEKRGKKATRQRTWKVGGKTGFELVLSKFTGNAVKEFAERSGQEAGAKSLHFGAIATWPDAFRLGAPAAE